MIDKGYVERIINDIAPCVCESGSSTYHANRIEEMVTDLVFQEIRALCRQCEECKHGKSNNFGDRITEFREFNL